MVEMAALTEKQQVAEAAHSIIQALDLVVDVIGRARKHRVGVHELLHGGRAMLDGIAVAIAHEAFAAALQHADVGVDRVVARRIGEGLRNNRRGAHVIGDQVGAPQAFGPSGADADAGRIGEPVRPCRPSQFLGALAVAIEHRPRDASRQQRADHMPLLGGHDAALDAEPRHPHGRRGLLQRARPDVDVAILEILTFPIEWPRGRRHRLDDQVVRFPIAAHQTGGIGVGGVNFVRRALDEPHFQPPTREHVEPGHFLGHANRIGAVRNRVAQ